MLSGFGLEDFSCHSRQRMLPEVSVRRAEVACD